MIFPPGNLAVHRHSSTILCSSALCFPLSGGHTPQHGANTVSCWALHNFICPHWVPITEELLASALGRLMSVTPFLCLAQWSSVFGCPQNDTLLQWYVSCYLTIWISLRNLAELGTDTITSNKVKIFFEFQLISFSNLNNSLRGHWACLHV